MSAGWESHRDRFRPHEWQRLLKMSALYAQLFEAKIHGGQGQNRRTGEEILSLTLSRMKEGCDGYAFKDGDILFFHCLCRCCRRTILMLRQQDTAARAPQPLEEDDMTPVVLTEQAAVAFLERRKGLVQFHAFLKDRKLKGKLRAYSTGFPRYAAENCDLERIAKDLRVTPATVAKYRSRLRELLEEFEIERAWRQPA